MNCAQVSQKIELFVLGDVAAPEQAAIEAHLATCPACREAETQYRLLVAQIKQVSQPDALRLDFVRSVDSATKAEIRRIAHRLLVRRVIVTTASAAACFLLAWALWRVWLQEPGPVGAPSIAHVWQHGGAISVPGSLADDVVVHAQNVYLLQQSSQEAHLAALDIKTGRQNWLSDVQACGHILADDSRVYCVAQGGAGELDLVALDAADGKTLWRYPQPSVEPLRGPTRPTLLPAGRICWSTSGTVQMLNCSNGQLVWRRSIPEGGALSAPVLVDNDVCVANAGGIYCLNSATGDPSWRLPCGGTASLLDRPLLAAADAGIYACLRVGLAGSRLICIEPTTHEVLWSRNVAHVTGLYAIDDMLYLRDQNIRAIDGVTGKLLWTCPATGCNPVTYEGPLAYFVDSGDDGGLVALNRYTGSKVWELAGMKSCSPFVKIGGTGYMKTHDGVVHAIVFKG